MNDLKTLKILHFVDSWGHHVNLSKTCRTYKLIISESPEHCAQDTQEHLSIHF